MIIVCVILEARSPSDLLSLCQGDEWWQKTAGSFGPREASQHGNLLLSLVSVRFADTCHLGLELENIPVSIHTLNIRDWEDTLEGLKVGKVERYTPYIRD